MWIRQVTLPAATIQVNQIVSPTMHYMHSCVVVDRQPNSAIQAKLELHYRRPVQWEFGLSRSNYKLLKLVSYQLSR